MTKSIFSSQYDRLCIFLIKARLDAGLSQQELARHLGRPQSFVSKYESKQRRLDVIELLEVVHALRTDGLGFIARLLEGWPENTGAASPGGLWMASDSGSDDGDGRVEGDGTTPRLARRGRGGAMVRMGAFERRKRRVGADAPEVHCGIGFLNRCPPDCALGIGRRRTRRRRALKTALRRPPQSPTRGAGDPPPDHREA